MLLMLILFSICQLHLFSTNIYNITVFHIWKQMYILPKIFKVSKLHRILGLCTPIEWVGLEQPWFRFSWLIDQVSLFHQSWFDTLDSSDGTFACKYCRRMQSMNPSNLVHLKVCANTGRCLNYKWYFYRQWSIYSWIPPHAYCSWFFMAVSHISSSKPSSRIRTYASTISRNFFPSLDANLCWISQPAAKIMAICTLRSMLGTWTGLPTVKPGVLFP